MPLNLNYRIMKLNRAGHSDQLYYHYFLWIHSIMKIMELRFVFGENGSLQFLFYRLVSIRILLKSSALKRTYKCFYSRQLRKEANEKQIFLSLKDNKERTHPSYTQYVHSSSHSLEAKNSPNMNIWKNKEKLLSEVLPKNIKILCMFSITIYAPNGC